MENLQNNPIERQRSSPQLEMANEINLAFAVKEITVTGEENIRQIPKGARVVVLTTHMTDLDVPLAIHALAERLDLAVMNLSTHHKFSGPKGEMPTNIGIRFAGKSNFLPIDYHKDKTGKKSPKAFNPENFEMATEAIKKGKTIVTAAHNPSRKPLQNLEGVKGGYGGVYLALLNNAWVLPVASVLDRPTGMYESMLKTVIKDRPNASVAIGRPFQLAHIEGIEHFTELQKKKNLTEAERAEFSRLANALRERSQVVMEHLSQQLVTHNE